MNKRLLCLIAAGLVLAGCAKKDISSSPHYPASRIEQTQKINLRPHQERLAPLSSTLRKKGFKTELSQKGDDLEYIIADSSGLPLREFHFHPDKHQLPFVTFYGKPTKRRNLNFTLWSNRMPMTIEPYVLADGHKQDGMHLIGMMKNGEGMYNLDILPIFNGYHEGNFITDYDIPHVGVVRLEKGLFKAYPIKKMSFFENQDQKLILSGIFDGNQDILEYLIKKDMYTAAGHIVKNLKKSYPGIQFNGDHLNLLDKFQRKK